MRLFFDESGNTGTNLSDSQQPIFALSSINISADEANGLLAELMRPGQSEVKFSKLRRTAEGRQAVIRLIDSDALTPRTAKFAIADKRYYLISHYVDKLTEPVHYDLGVDLYAKDAHVAYANVLYFAGSHIFPNGHWDALLNAFLGAIRGPSDESYRALDRTAALAVSNAIPDSAEFSMPLMLAAPQAKKLLKGFVNTATFDPALDLFAILVQAWMRESDGYLDITHDQSKPMKLPEDFLRQLMRRDVSNRIIGFRGRQAELPLRVSTLEFGDSRAHSQLQLADIVAGAAVAAFSPSRTEDEAADWERVREAPYALVVGPMWPSVSNIGGAASDPQPGEGSLVDGQMQFFRDSGYFDH
ncbi:uncharacterized protein DUF3800 [Paraburkholderia sp. BL6665CI2N2]|uniref:DUF3800 domain-containing protein n=1 Tax=Paraburkholderia sp. BL6665CI2N2 TaxID=1938806 RepID=UPI001064BF34|nr:DUF3800 domain-containing protein [Paraburkholderia sp. BL6665CI2N2]TDY21968.1 uncharacterized protein DUF3800 [Paraburkholderia sp. BL6665CI2N2]